MPEICLQKNGTNRKPSIAFGDKFLTDSPIDQPSPGAWNILLQQILSPIPQRKGYLIALSASHEPYEISDWSERRDPSTQEGLQDNEEAQVQKLILRIKTSLTIPNRESLSNRLITLFNDAKEDDATSPGISVGSLRYFYCFLQLHPNLKCPTISLTPEYNIYASWRSERNKVFSVHFLPNGDTRFVIFKPNKSHPEKQVRFSGIATTDTIMDEVSPKGELDWISE